MPNLKLVIFDMDGLMFDTEVFYCDRIEDYCKAKGIDVDITAIHQVIGTSDPIDYNLFNKSALTNEAVKKVVDEAHGQSLEYVKTYGAPIKKGLYELISYLKSQKIKMVVATSTRIEISGPILKHANIFDDFEFIITGKEVARGKPYPDIFLKALERIGVEKEEALILEDSNNGGLAAKRANIPYIIVPDINAPTAEIASGALFIAESLLSVKAQLEKGF